MLTVYPLGMTGNRGWIAAGEAPAAAGGIGTIGGKGGAVTNGAAADGGMKGGGGGGGATP